MFKKKLSTDESIVKAFSECPLFVGFSDWELRMLLKNAHIRDYSADEMVFSEGTLGLCFYIIAKGSVEIISENTEAKPKVLRKYGEGAFFSEVHLFTETNHTVSCVSKEVTKLIIFSKPEVEDLIRLKPKTGNKLLLNFLEYLSEQLDTLYKENKELLKKIPDGAAY
jgi:CRP/FNR family transcriptional regulator, cyclic AMP receptor protein